MKSTSRAPSRNRIAKICIISARSGKFLGRAFAAALMYACFHHSRDTLTEVKLIPRQMDQGLLTMRLLQAPLRPSRSKVEKCRYLLAEAGAVIKRWRRSWDTTF